MDGVEAKARLIWLEDLLSEPLDGHIDVFVRNVLKEVLYGEIPKPYFDLVDKTRSS